MLIDGLIVIFLISALFRGREIGFVRQAGSTIGFFGGLFVGAWLEPHTIRLVHTATGRSLIAIMTTIGCALLLLTLGEYLGLRLKHRVVLRRINIWDNRLGAALAIISTLISAWLIAAIISTLSLAGIQPILHRSWIISTLDKELPSAPALIADLGHLIDPNGFPQVFVGNEPAPRSNANLPSLGNLQSAVNKDRESVVKIEGQGCGGIVEGSGFVAGAGIVATNAHVVAGIPRPYVQDSKGSHSATVIWFDPNLDFAVLRVSNLAGHSLVISTHTARSGTPTATLGYPGGGAFSADPAVVLDELTATGRNIYGQDITNRDIYELQANVVPGNSGGPLINTDGSVIGVVFAESTTYQHVGYALNSSQIIDEINQAVAQNQPVGSGQCTD